MKKYLSLIVFLLIGAVLFQGFQCSSREMTTAKLAMTNRDYPKAIEYFQKEIDKNPNNGEAWMGLVQANIITNKVSAAIAAIHKGEKLIKDPDLRAKIPGFKNKLWVGAYNAGINDYNQFLSTQNKKFLDASINKFDLAISIRPANPDFYNLKGVAYEAKGDTAKAIDTYKKYIGLYAPTLRMAKEKGISLDLKRDGAIDRLGKPAFSESISLNPTDIHYSDLFMINGKEFFVYSFEKKPEAARIKGFRYDPPKEWLKGEKMQFNKLSTAPYSYIAQTHFNNGDNKKALSYVDMMTALEPLNKEAGRFKVSLMQETGDIEGAYKTLEEILKKDPKNKQAWAQYGDLFFNAQKYEEAIQQYEKALEIDKDYATVLRYVASAYKNKAGIIQQDEQDKADNDANYQYKREAYFPELKKAAEYFERARKSSQFRDDVETLGELANIYEVVDNRPMLKMTIDELKALENICKNKKKYYLIMMKIYGRLDMEKEETEVMKKYEALTK